MNQESDLYRLPKDILIKLIINIRTDVEKECEEKHKKETEKYKLLEWACKNYFPKRNRRSNAIEILECKFPGYSAYSVMDTYDWIGVHKNCEDMNEISCTNNPDVFHYICDKHFKYQYQEEEEEEIPCKVCIDIAQNK